MIQKAAIPSSRCYHISLPQSCDFIRRLSLYQPVTIFTSLDISPVSRNPSSISGPATAYAPAPPRPALPAPRSVRSPPTYKLKRSIIWWAGPAITGAAAITRWRAGRPRCRLINEVFIAGRPAVPFPLAIERRGPARRRRMCAVTARPDRATCWTGRTTRWTERTAGPRGGLRGPRDHGVDWEDRRITGWTERTTGPLDHGVN